MKHLVALVAGAQGEEITVDFECGKASAMRAHVVFETAEAKACEEEILGLNKVPTWCSPELLE